MAHHHHRPQLSQEAIFSPSVARIAASTARDWSFVDAWLRARLPPSTPLPTFERNPDTLKGLLALVTLNEAADEDRALIARCDAANLRELNLLDTANNATGKSGRPLREGLLDALEMNLTTEAQTALHAMAQASLSLGVAYPEPESLGRRMVDLQANIYDTEQIKARVDTLQRYVDDDAARGAQLLHDLDSDPFKAPANLARQNLDMQRRIKAMDVKIPTLFGQGASGDASSYPVEDLVRDEREYLSILSRKKELDLQMASFCGLPSDTDMARSELEVLRDQLRTVTSRRDAVFEGLVERESPAKRR